MLGRLQQVKSVTALEVKLKETPVATADGPSTVDISSESGSSSNCCTEQRKEEEDFEIKKPPCSHIPSVDTEELSEEQKTIVRKMLEQEAESFSQTDDDVGGAEELQVDINLTDSVPVQKRYNSIPQLLHAEVKQYVEDLLNRDWIQKSRSAYSSPVVCVRKRGGTLRLSHPLPRVQDTLQSLGGNQWFSLLDQGKAIIKVS